MTPPVPISPPTQEEDASSTSSSPLALDPSTLAALSSFYEEQSEIARQFDELTERVGERHEKMKNEDDERMMSVEEFRKLFQENFGFSQFWYSTDFSEKLADFVYRHVQDDPSQNVAFLCSPTGFVGLQHFRPLKNVYLLEYDHRFGLLSKNFVPYDLFKPEELPMHLKGAIDLAVCDPPYLNEDTNVNLATSLRFLLRPKTGRFLLLTSTSVESILPKVYSTPPTGPLYQTEHLIKVTHAGGIQNTFGSWANWNVDGACELLE